MSGPEDKRYDRYTDPGTGKPDLGLFMEAVAADAKAYFEAQKELTTLAVGEKLGRAVAVLLAVVVLILVLSAAFLMGSVALSLWLGEVLGSVMLGFLAVAGIYVVLGGLFYLLWRAVLRDQVTLAVIKAIHGNA